jgi:hypothetical protein
MYIYYKPNGDIVSMAEIEIVVDGAKQLKIDEEIDPRDYIVINDELQKRSIQLQTVTVNEELKPLDENTIFLNATDYKVIKYRDQLDLGITPDLTESEYIALLQKRQDARNAISASKEIK